MAGEWQHQALERVAELSGGYAFKSDDYSQEGRFVLRTLNIKDDGSINRDDAVYIPLEQCSQYQRFELEEHDTLFVMVGATLGKVGYVRRETLPALLNQNMWRIRGREGLCDKRYLQYAFRYSVSKNLGWASGSARDFVRRDDYRTMEIPVPTLPQQKAIASILGALDDKIELNRKMNVTLEAMARALFKSWFVDFDPVRAKLDGRKPIGMDNATAALFPDSFEDSELGHIPHGWQVNSIDQLAERVAMGPFGSDIKVSTFVPEGVPVISGQHLRGTLLDDSEFNFVSVEHADRLKRTNVQRGDVIFTHAGSIGQVAYIPETSRYERYIVSQRQFYMRCNRALVSPFYITSYFQTPEGQHRLLANTSSTGVPSISQPVTYLRQLKMVVPHPALLQVFDKTVGQIHLKMADNDHQSRTLATLRDTLLPKLLSGSLRVDSNQLLTG